MKKIFTTGVAVGLLAFAISGMKATAQDLDVTLNVKATAHTQGESTENENGNFSDSIDTIKVTTQDILTRIQEATGITVPKGSRLVALTGGTFDDFDTTIEVWNSNNEAIVDSFELFIAGIDFTIHSSDSIFKAKGKETDNTFKTKESSFFIVTIFFDDGPFDEDSGTGGNSFELTGEGQASYSESANFDNDTFKQATSFKATVAGQATIGGNSAIVSGSLTGDGSISDREIALQ